MALELPGKAALVTGGGSGISLAFVKKLLSRDCDVVIVDLKLTPEAEKLVQDHSSHSGTDRPTKARFFQADVTKWHELQNAFAFTVKELGRLDIVVPGAGVFEPDSSSFWHFQESNTAALSSPSSYTTFDVNITHPVRTTQLAIDHFLRQRPISTSTSTPNSDGISSVVSSGVIILISSIAAQLPLLPAPLYAASKHAISGFTRSLSDLEPRLGLRVVAVAPGCVRTPLWAADKMHWFDEAVDTWVDVDRVADVMLDLVTQPELVGGTVLEVGADLVRSVNALNDPGPAGRGHTMANVGVAVEDVYAEIGRRFGK